jgi:hypothetical protein
MKGNYVKDEFLFCSPLNTTATSADILWKMSLFFEEERIQLEIHMASTKTVYFPCDLDSKQL